MYRNWCADADHWMQTLAERLPWHRSEVRVFGRLHPIPRLEAFLGEQGVRYRYSGQLLEARGWPDFIRPLVAAVNDATGVAFNAALANWYRGGDDRMGWHADNEPELGPNPVLASLSFGARRDFRLRRIGNHRDTLTIALGEGDLLVMGASLQHHWQHCVPKRARARERINLTFRRVLT